MKKLTTNLFLLITAFAAAQTTTFQWGNKISSEMSKPMTVNKTKTDQLGNTFSIGGFSGKVDFDADVTADFLTTKDQKIDLFITKTNGLGELVWVKKVECAKEITGKSLDFDAEGNIYITGDFNGDTDFNPNFIETNILRSIETNIDVFVLKLDGNGNYIWAKNIGNQEVNEATDLAVDSSGNVVVIGQFRGALDFNPNKVLNFGMTANTLGTGTCFIWKMTPGGMFIWARSIVDNNTSFCKGNKVATDSNNNVYVCGSFTGTVRFNFFGTLKDNVTSMGNADGFILKTDAEGTYQYANQIGGESTDKLTTLNLDQDANVFAIGTYKKIADFDPSASIFNLTNNVTTGTLTSDIFIAKYTSKGQFVWAKSFGSNLDEFAKAIQVDNSGNIYCEGNFKGTVDFDPSANVSQLQGATDATKTNVFFSKLTSKGDLVWAKKISGTDAVLAAGLGLDNFNNLYVSGTFAPDILDLNPDNEVFNVATTQTFNSFLIKMSQQTIDESNIDIASNFKVVPKKNSKDYHIKISEKLIGATANIYDYLGKPIEKFSLTSLQTSKELAKGLYTVEIEFAGKSSSKKITIN